MLALSLSLFDVCRERKTVGPRRSRKNAYTRCDTRTLRVCSGRVSLSLSLSLLLFLSILYAVGTDAHTHGRLVALLPSPAHSVSLSFRLCSRAARRRSLSLSFWGSAARSFVRRGREREKESPGAAACGERCCAHTGGPGTRAQARLKTASGQL